MNLSESEISGIVARLAAEIRKDYSGKTLILVGVLKGAYAFTADLMRALDMDVEIDFVRLTRVDDTVTLVKDISRDLHNHHVLIVEELIDSGRTVKFLYDRLIQSQPASLGIVTLLNKPANRKVGVPVKYVGQSITGNEFLVGYGLDQNEGLRNLADIKPV